MRIAMKVLGALIAAISISALTSLPVAAQSEKAPAKKAASKAATKQVEVQPAKAALKSADGKDIGSAELTQTPAGVLIKLAVKGLPPGEHAFHVHAVGKCEAPFTSAGGHFNPRGKKHGIAAAEGHHAGDMPNLHVPASGELVVEVVNAAITLAKGRPNSLFGKDGTALIIHAGKDDYKTDPTGDAGGRIACGIVE
jgi:superoxide dismutase, Cu-Zn family